MRSKLAVLGKQVGAHISVGLHKMFGSRVNNGFGILMYHRVTEVRPGVPAPTWNVTPDRFHAQLHGLLARGYRFMSLRAVIERSRAGLLVPEKTAVITFDDGFQNVYLHAWPILKGLKIPATVFVPTFFVDRTLPAGFDRWGTRYQSRTPPCDWQLMTWAQCQELERSGLIEIGSHSHTHSDFRDRTGDFERDLSASVATLRDKLGRADFTFSFPYGGRRLGYADDGLMLAVRRTRVLCALTTETELANPRGDPFGWGRFEVVQSDTAATIAAKLEGWYNWMGRVREVFRLLSPPPSGFARNDSEVAS